MEMSRLAKYAHQEFENDKKGMEYTFLEILPKILILGKVTLNLTGRNKLWSIFQDKKLVEHLF